MTLAANIFFVDFVSLRFAVNNGNFKENRHHQNLSKQPGKQRKQDKIYLSGALLCCCYCVKSELFCPRCLNE